MGREIEKDYRRRERERERERERKREREERKRDIDREKGLKGTLCMQFLKQPV